MIVNQNFTPDDYETPDHIAEAMAKLIKPTDKYVLEPFAGTGQIIKYLPTRCWTDAIEIKTLRYLQLGYANYCTSYNDDFFNFEFFKNYKIPGYDLIISNPPFSLIMDAIELSLDLLNPENPEARILFLVPISTFSSVARSERLKQLHCFIHHTYLIPQRVDYLKDGTPMSKTQRVKDGVPQFNRQGKPIFCSGRQEYDAVYDIRPGNTDLHTSFLF